MPTLERADSDGDGAGELGVGWASLAGEAGAAVSGESGTAGLSCPAGMALDGDLCKTPVTDYVEEDRVCPQAAEGYVLVSASGELGDSHSCQKTVPAYCTGGKILRDGQCWTETVERRDPTWVCSEGTLASTFLDPGYSYSCRVAVDPPECPEDGESYLTDPAGGCYVEVTYFLTQGYTWICSEGTPVTTSGDHGVSHSCRIAVSPPTCRAGETYRNNRCETEETYYKTRGYTWGCAQGTRVTTSGDHGVSYSCRIAVSPPTCPEGETYRNNRCETEETYYKTRGYTWGCSQGTRVTTSGDHGVSYSCRIAVSPPTCPAGETYRNNRCETEETYYKTRGYTWGCAQGTRVTTSGDHGVSYSCRIAVSPPTCPEGETYRNNRCETRQTYYKSRPYDYSCPSGYTLKTSGVTRSCSKTETYRKRVCSFDPIAGERCWWETRTRTLSAAVTESCASGYSPDGTGCTADSPSTRWVRTSSSPTRHRYEPATSSCPSGWSDNGAQCQSNTASTRWVRTSSSPTRHRYEPATSSCPSGWSDNGAQCQSNTASTRWVRTSSSPTRHRYEPATSSCPSGWSDNGAQCQSNTASTRWAVTASTPTRHRYVPATSSCPSGWSDNGTQCQSNTASTRWDPTDSTPITSRTAADPARTCDGGFAWNDTSSKCEKTTYADAVAPRTKLVGTPPTVSCREGYGPAGGGRCSRTTLGDPTAVPTGAGCITDLGTLGAGDVSRAGTLAAGCTSLRKGDAQNVYWARRFSLRVSAAATAAFTASSSSADAYLYVLSGSGSGAEVTEVASDDDSGAGTDAAVAGVALAAGVTYTVEVTTSAATTDGGAFTLTGTIALDEPPVVISGLDDGTGWGLAAATVTAADGFAVEPADASCTAAAAAAAGVAPTVAAGAAAGERTVSLALAAPFSHDVTVTCDAPGRTATEVTVTLAGKVAIGTVTVAAGAACAATTGTAGYACTVPRDGALSVTATAQGAHSGLSVAWAAAGGATATPSDQAAAADVPGVGFSLTSAATLACTADGTVTVTVTAGGVTKTVTVSVRCAPPADAVTISGLADASRLRAGTVTAPFTVAPHDAACTAAPAAATVAVTDAVGGRALSATLGALSAVKATVTCTAPAHAAASQAVTLSAHGRCASPLGILPHGVTKAAGTVAEAAVCRSEQRVASAGHGGYYAHRHTFTLAGPATVTVSLGAAPPASFDPYLLLLDGIRTTSGVLARNDNRSSSDNDPRVGPLRLQAGTYTAEATTSLAGAAGSYTLAVDTAYDPVVITGLDDSTGRGTAASVTVTEEFTVSPAAAACSSSSPGTVTTPVGGAAGARLLSADLAVGTASTLTVTCTHDGRADGIEDVELAAAEPPLSVAVSGRTCTAVSPAPVGADSGYSCVLSDEHRLTLTATADADDRSISIGWAAASGVTVSRSSTDAAAAVAARNGELTGAWRRVGTATVECTSDAAVTLTVTVGSGAGAVTRTAEAAIDCEDQGSIAGLEDVSTSGTAAVRASDGFTVTPPTAECAATATVGAPTVSGGVGGLRTVVVGLTPAAGEVVSSVVRVDCTPPGHAPVAASATFAVGYVDSCDDPLGVLEAGVTSRSGTITADSGCVSPQRLKNGGNDASRYARRHSFVLANPGTLTIELGSAPGARPLDTYVLLLEDHSQNGGGAVLGRDDDAGPGYDSLLPRVRLGPGRYTVEATTHGYRGVGAYGLRIDARLRVLIDGFEGGSRVGVGAVGGRFSVAPADAECTPGVGAAVVADGSRRTLTATLTALGDTDVFVSCTRPGYLEAVAVATFTALDPVSDVTVTATAGGSCKPSGDTLDAGVDSKYECTMTSGDQNQMTVAAEATGPSSRMTLGWAAGGGVRAVPALGGLDVSVVGGAVVFARAGTAAVRCTADADITLTVTIPDDNGRRVTRHTTEIAVDCQPPVVITDYTAGTRNGPGAMTGTFDVAPATATCRARNAGGIAGVPVPAGAGTNRTVSVATTGTGELAVEVECSDPGYATGTAVAQFRANDEAACRTPLATLRHGARTFVASLGATSCTSRQRSPGSSSTFRAHRYAFTLASAGRVSVRLEPTGTGDAALDTYLLLLGGHGSDGAVLHSHNNLRGDATRLDGVLLSAGDYTIEATTALSNAIGGYRLRVEADFAAQPTGLPATVTATVGQTKKHRFSYRLHDAAVTVQSVTPTGLTATVTAMHGSAAVDLTPDKARTSTVTIAITASGRTTTRTITVNTTCQTGYRPSLDGTCQPLAPTLDESCMSDMATDHPWGRRISDSSMEAVISGQCSSVTFPQRYAAYFRWTQPEPASQSARSTNLAQVDVDLDVEPNALLVPIPDDFPLYDITLWRVESSGRGRPIARSPEAPVATRSTRSNTQVSHLFGVSGGTYVIEVVPQGSSADDYLHYGDFLDEFRVRVTSPPGPQQHSDVELLGRTKRNGSGASMAGFLEARGTIDYAENHGDPFRPSSEVYPWLAFSSDGCTVPEGTWERIGVSAVLLIWMPLRDILAIDSFATVDSHLLALALESWDRLVDPVQGANDFLRSLEIVTFGQSLDQSMTFEDVEVPLYLACLRHDFNWRNLHRVEYELNPNVDSWTDAARGRADARFESDLDYLCRMNPVDARVSTHFDWQLPTTAAISSCLVKASYLVDVVAAMPEIAIGFFYPHRYE